MKIELTESEFHLIRRALLRMKMHCECRLDSNYIRNSGSLSKEDKEELETLLNNTKQLILHKFKEAKVDENSDNCKSNLLS